MRVLIIEDELPASEKLIGFLRRYNSAITILAVIESVSDTVQWLREHQMPDLIFSDIELLDGNIFRVFENVTITCPIVFTTAYDEFLLRAFQENSIGYLLKPFEYDELCIALQKFERLMHNFTHVSLQTVHLLQATLQPPVYKERFVIKARNGIHLLLTHSIVYIQLKNEVAIASDTKGSKHLLNEGLGQLEELLDPKDFFRINRSEIINLHYIEKLEHYGKERLAIQLKHAEQTLISSANRTPGLRKWLQS